MKVFFGLIIVLAATASGCSSLSNKNTIRAGVLNAELGREYISAGNLALAKEKLDRALNNAPEDPFVLNSYGLLLDQMDEPGRAIEMHQKAVASEPGNISYLNAYAASLCTAGQGANAISVFERAAELKTNREPERALDNAAFCALKMGQYPQAISFANRALDFAPDYPLAILHLGESLARTGETEEALGLINQYHQKEAHHTANSLFIAVSVARAAGDELAAESYKEQLLSRFPDSKPAIHFKRGRS